MDESTQEHCPNCTKTGLPIFPVRYSVARNDDEVRDKAPALFAPYGDGVEAIQLPEDKARYTLRMLNNGYLYVYDEARDDWRAYQVDDSGTLHEFPVGESAPPLDPAEAVCSRHGAPDIATCVTVEVAEEAEIIWMAFSIVEWTQQTLEKHQDESFRERNMRKIDVAAWLASQADQPHVGEFARSAECLAESSIPLMPVPRQVAHSTVSYDTVTALKGARAFLSSLLGELSRGKVFVENVFERMEDAARRAFPEKQPSAIPMMVALEDPVSIAADINQLAIEFLTEWEDDYERRERRLGASAIAALKEAIHQGAVEREEDVRKESALLGRAIGVALGGSAARRLMPIEAIDDGMFSIEEDAEIRRLGEKSWKKYRKSLKGNGEDEEFEVWLNEVYPGQQKAFYETEIEALDRSYLAWLRSDRLLGYMECNFDSADIMNGLQYQEAVGVMLQDATSRGPVWNYVEECLNRFNPEDSSAIFLRAQVWNQDCLVEQWRGAVEKQDGADWPAFLASVDNMYASINSLLGAYHQGILTGALANSAKYIEQMAGPLTRMIGRASSSLATNAAMLLPQKAQMALLSGLVKVEDPLTEVINLRGYVGTQAASRALASAIAQDAGINEMPARHASRTVFRRDGIDPARGRMPFSMVVLADHDRLRLMQSLNIRNVASGAQFHGEHLSAVYQSYEFKHILRLNIAKTGNQGTTLGVIGLIFGTASLGGFAYEYKRAAGADRTIKAANLAAGVVGLVGNGVEVAGRFGEGLPWLSQRLDKPRGRWLHNANTRAGLVASVGRWLAGIGGVLLGGLMIFDGYHDRNLSRGYAIAAMGMGVASIIVGILLFSSSSGPGVVIGIVLSILVAVVATVVSWFKPDEIQRWLDKVLHFGRNRSGVFSDFDEQMDAQATILN